MIGSVRNEEVEGAPVRPDEHIADPGHGGRPNSHRWPGSFGLRTGGDGKNAEENCGTCDAPRRASHIVPVAHGRRKVPADKVMAIIGNSGRAGRD
jgi:hypothetical protein